MEAASCVLWIYTLMVIIQCKLINIVASVLFFVYGIQSKIALQQEIKP